MIRRTIFAAAVLMCVASYARATLIAEWTFEVSVPATAGPHTAEGGVNAASSLALGSHSNGATVYSNPSGNGSNESFSSNTWSVGDYYEFCTSTTGYDTIVVSWDQAGSNTGPRDFDLKSSADGYTASLLAYTVLLSTWNPGSGSAGFSYSVPVPALDNTAAACFRLIDSSTVSINGSTVATGGTDRVDNVQVNGSVVPEPTTLALLALGGFGLIRRRR